VDCPASTTGIMHLPGPTDIPDGALILAAGWMHEERRGACEVAQVLHRGHPGADADAGAAGGVELIADPAWKAWAAAVRAVARPLGGRRVRVAARVRRQAATSACAGR